MNDGASWVFTKRNCCSKFSRYLYKLINNFLFNTLSTQVDGGSWLTAVELTWPGLVPSYITYNVTDYACIVLRGLRKIYFLRLLFWKHAQHKSSSIIRITATEVEITIIRLTYFFLFCIPSNYNVHTHLNTITRAKLCIKSATNIRTRAEYLSVCLLNVWRTNWGGRMKVVT